MHSCLKFRTRAAAAATKASQFMAVLDESALPMLLKTLVRPYLEFGNVAWDTFDRVDQPLIECVPRRATRLVADIRHLPYEKRLEILRLPSFFYRRRRGDMIQVYQLFHGGGPRRQ